MKQIDTGFQTYNDGIATIYTVEKNGDPGDLKKDVLVPKASGVRYEERIVGLTRFYGGKQQKIRIDQLLRMPRINSVTTNDIVKATDGNQYEVKQVQYPPNIYPPSMDLSLERSSVKYDNPAETS